MTELIDTFHGGNVRDAARHIGIPQQTLNRIARGGYKQSPRADALEMIAAAYPGVTVDWLLTGHGVGPRKVDEGGRPITAARLRWEAVVQRLLAAFDAASGESPVDRGLTREGERTLLRSGLRALTVGPSLLAATAIGVAGEMDKRRAARHIEHLRASFDGAAQFWADFFERAIEIEGEDRVINGLRRHLSLLLIGFSDLHAAEELAKKPDWFRGYAEFLQRNEAKGSPSVRPQDSASS